MKTVKGICPHVPSQHSECSDTELISKKEGSEGNSNSTHCFWKNN